MTLDLDSAWLKFNWAVEHLKALYAMHDRVIAEAERQPALAQPYPHPKNKRCRIFTVHGLVKPDERMSLLLGDYLTNLRAALDHLAWELVQKGSTPNPKNPSAVQFPIALVGAVKGKKGRRKGRRAKFIDWAREERLPGVSRANRAIIDRYQPYHRDGLGQPLAVLNKLVNDDKHRIVTPVSLNALIFQPKILTVRNGSILRYVVKIRPGQLMDDGAEILRVYVDNPEAEVEVNTDLARVIALGESPAYFPDLDKMGRLVAEILRQFGKAPTWAVRT